MKNLITLSLIVFFIIGSFGAKAQVDFGSFLEAGQADATLLMERYMEPGFLGLGYGMNSGWYNTAKPHKLLGFDITPTVTMALVPSDAEFFTFNDADYQNASLNSASPTNRAPTLLGPNLPADQLPLIDYENGASAISVSSPTGLGLDEDLAFNAVPTGMVQLGLGIVKNTDLKIRFIPTIESEGEYEFSMFGIGVMHDLKQWIPGLKQLPLDFSGFVGWNRINTVIFLDDNAPDQKAELSTSGFTLQGLVSKQLSILTVFGGLGFATSTTNFDLLGTYDIEDSQLVDPVSFDFTSGGPRLNLGFRLKLLILTLHADYAIQKYNTLTVGVGLSVR